MGQTEWKKNKQSGRKNFRQINQILFAIKVNEFWTKRPWIPMLPNGRTMVTQ